MPRFTNIYEVDNLYDLSIIKLALNKNNIEFNVKGEHTLMLGGVYSMGNHGAILEVLNEQIEDAIVIIEGLGFEIFYNKENVQFGFVNKIQEWTGSIPFLSRLNLGYRVFLICFLSVIFFFGFWMFSFLQKNKIKIEELKYKQLCVERIEYKGKELEIFTENIVGVYFDFPNVCNEEIEFNLNGKVSFPGISSTRIHANYLIKNNHLIVTNVDKYKDVFEGNYEIITSIFGGLILESDKTRIELSDG